RVGRLLHGTLQVCAHAGSVTCGRIGDPTPGLEPARTQWARMLCGDRCRAVDPHPGLVDLAEVEDGHRRPAGGQELEVRIADLPGVPVGLPAFAERQGR